MVWQSRGMRNCLVLAAVCGMTIQVPFSVQAQSYSVPGSETRFGSAPDGSEPAGSAPATSFIPSLRIAERYDSNVYFVQGTNLEDYVTTVSPQLKLAHKNQWVEGFVLGGARGEAYVNNPGLNYVGGNGTVDLNLDRAMNALVPGLGLRVSDNIFYTPQPPAFAAPVGGSQLSEVFVEGIQIRRTNSFMNAANAEASYFFSQQMGVISTYTDRRMRFGKPLFTPTGAVPGNPLDVNFQTLTSGLIGMPSPADTISLLHQYQKAAYPNGFGSGGDSPNNGATGGFSTQGAIARWSRLITPTLQATGEGGFTVISASGGVYPIGVASLEWNGRYTTVLASYSRRVVPSIMVASTPLVSQAVTGAVTRRIAESLALSLRVSYALNQSVPDTSLLRFESYMVAPSLEYKIGRTLTATLSYRHYEFKRDVREQPADFDRNIVMLALSGVWE